MSTVRKRWRAFLLVILTFAVAGVAYGSLSTKMYEATAQVFVSASVASDAQQLAQGNTFAQARVQTYTDVADSPEVVDFVVSQLGLTESANSVAGEISADAPSGKVLINLNVTDRSPQRAAQLANAVAQRFTTVVQDMERTSGSETSPVKLTVFKPASVPSRPSSPRPVLDVVLAVALGLVVGALVVWLREVTDTSIKSVDQLAAVAQAPVLAAVPLDKRIADSPVAFRSDGHGARAEAFRHLRTNLQFVNVDQPPRVIAVTSALAGEGKSHTAVNLAAALAEAGQKVCLIEADLRRPTIAQILGLVGDAGLTSVLIGQAKVADVLQDFGDNLAVLTAGAVPPNPSELLLSNTFRDVLAYVSRKVDVVVLDTAPLLAVVDGLETAALADATILTVRASSTSKDQVHRAVTSLSNVGVRPVGVVLSMSTDRRTASYAYYESYRPQTSTVAKEVTAGSGVDSEHPDSKPAHLADVG